MESNDLVLIEAVFFVSSFNSIMDELGINESELDEYLVSLLNKGHIDQMRFDETLKDYLVIDNHDLNRLQDYHYVATKKVY